MSKKPLAAGILTVVLGALVVALVAATSTVRYDVCSAAYHECTAMAEGLGDLVDCRIEVAHCRSVGHFEFPDGTVKQFPEDVSGRGRELTRGR